MSIELIGISLQVDVLAEPVADGEGRVGGYEDPLRGLNDAEKEVSAISIEDNISSVVRTNVEEEGLEKSKDYVLSLT